MKAMKKNNRVLLTGGAGFIGSHLAKAILANGASLTIVDNLNDFYSPAWKRANLNGIKTLGDEVDVAEVDICDFEPLREVFKRAQPEVVIHLAAYAGVRPSIEKPRLYEQVNLGGTQNLLDLSREFCAGKFVFGSSSSVYGATSKSPFSESQVEMRPISPYAATKLSGELMCYTYSHLFDMPIVCLRFFTVYGPRQRPDLAIHKFVALIEAGLPIPVFGDGLTGRDYTYVDDIVAGILAAVDYKPKDVTGAPYDIFNLGNSSPVTLLKLIETIEDATGEKAIREHRELQPGDVPLTWADISKAKTELGYMPATSLASGIKKFVSWYRAAAANEKLQFSRQLTGQKR